MRTIVDLQELDRRCHGRLSAVLLEDGPPRWVDDLLRSFQTLAESLGQNFDHLEQTFDERFDSLQGQMDRIVEKVDDLQETVESNTETLERHNATLLHVKQLSESQDDLLNQVRAVTEQVRAHTELHVDDRQILQRQEPADAERLHGRLEELQAITDRRIIQGEIENVILMVE